MKFVLAAATVFSLVGCNMLPGLQNIGAVAANNPLKGSPVEWSKDPPGVPLEGQKDCSTWPIQDHLSVTATKAQICAKGEVFKLVDARFDGPTEMSLGVASDGSGDSGLVAGRAGSIKGATPRKIGSCSDNTSTRNVWVTSYDACVPNKDPSGRPALTLRSSFLQVGDARWKFEPTPATTSAPTTVAQEK